MNNYIKDAIKEHKIKKYRIAILGSLCRYEEIINYNYLIYNF